MSRTALVPVLLGAAILLLTEYSRGDVLSTANPEQEMLSRPLDSYFAMHPDQEPHAVHTTGLDDWYKAKWELTGDSLFLTDITVRRFKEGLNWERVAFGSDSITVLRPEEGDSTSEDSVSVMEEVFPNRDRVHATWFTGYLICPGGEEVAPCSLSSWQTIHQHYSVIVVIDGLKHDKLSLSASEFCGFWDKQFRSYQKTLAYSSRIARYQATDDSLRAAGKVPHEEGRFDAIARAYDFATYISTIFGDTLTSK